MTKKQIHIKNLFPHIKDKIVEVYVGTSQHYLGCGIVKKWTGLYLVLEEFNTWNQQKWEGEYLVFCGRITKIEIL